MVSNLSSVERYLRRSNGFKTNYLRIVYLNSPQDIYRGKYKTNEFFCLCTLLEGEKRISVNSTDAFIYDQDSFVLVPPYSKILSNADRHTIGMIFVLSKDLIRAVSGYINNRSALNGRGDITTELFYLHRWNIESKNCINRLIEVLSETDRNGKSFYVDLIAQELVYNIFQINNTLPIFNYNDDNIISKSIKLMNENLYAPITIKELAHKLNVSESNFSHIFKKNFGSSPHDYLTDLKLAKAKDMLKDLNVTEVAFNLGYENISYFISIFKKNYGITPKQFQHKSKR